MKRLELIVTGKVQGISFRAATQQVAQKLEITGYAKNEADGSVRIVAEGEEHNLQSLLDWASRGPSIARIDSCTPTWSEAAGVFDHFSTL